MAKVTQEDRHRIVRALIAQGIPKARVIGELTSGRIELDDGTVVKVSDSTARRDYTAVVDEFRGLWSDEEQREVERGAAFDRIVKLAVDCGKVDPSGKPSATWRPNVALRANLQIIQLTSRDAREAWTGETDLGEEDERTSALRGKSQADLETEFAANQRRLRALGVPLVVLEGGKPNESAEEDTAEAG